VCTRRLMILVGLAVLATSDGYSAADTLYLKNGRVLTGQLVHRDQREVRFRMGAAGGKITYVKTFPAALVERVELAPPSSAPTSGPATHARPGLEPIADKQAFLGKLISQYKAHKYQPASLEVTRLIRTSSPAELNDLDQIVSEELGMSLAELAADLRIQAAIERARKMPPSPFQLGLVSPYELEALVAQLKREYTRLLDEPAVVREARPDRSGSERNAEEASDLQGPARVASTATGPSIRDWIDDADNYDGARTEAAAFARQIALALGLLQERMRLDPELRNDKALRTSLLAEQHRLRRLLIAARRRMRGMPTANERRAALEERRRRRREAPGRPGPPGPPPPTERRPADRAPPGPPANPPPDDGTNAAPPGPD